MVFDRRRGAGQQDTRRTGLGPSSATSPVLEHAATLQASYEQIYGTVVGIKWPLQFHGGKIAVSSGPEHLIENVQQILGTAKQEYIRLPAFGCDIHRRVFDQTSLAGIMVNDVRQAISNWEPRVTFRTADLDLTQAAAGIVSLQVKVEMKGTEEVLETGVQLSA